MAARPVLARCFRLLCAANRGVPLQNGHGLKRAPVLSDHWASVSFVRQHQCWAWRPPDKVLGIGQTWTYFDASRWGEEYETCSGDQQSPVDLVTSALVRDSDNLGSFHFANFQTTSGVSTTIVNNGHSAQVTYTDGDLFVSGGGLDDAYCVVQYHFHWGSVDDRGSEHTVDGRTYPMEMHVVAYNCKYGDMATAVGHSDGLAVLGFFFEISSKDNKGFKRIVHALGKITNPGTVYGMKPVPLMDLFPSDVNNYYRYAGGLTTPPCSEVVTWTVFRQPIPISAKQMEAFRNLKSREVDASGSLIALQDNYRPVQPLGGRSIRVNFKASQ